MFEYGGVVLLGNNDFSWSRILFPEVKIIRAVNFGNFSRKSVKKLFGVLSECMSCKLFHLEYKRCRFFKNLNIGNDLDLFKCHWHWSRFLFLHVNIYLYASSFSLRISEGNIICLFLIFSLMKVCECVGFCVCVVRFL